MTIPTITINPAYFVELGNMPMPVMMWRLFIDGGWIPTLIVLAQGAWMLWVQSRQQAYASHLEYTLLAVDVPRNNIQTPKAAEQIFTHLSGAYSGVDAFEKYWLGKFNPSFSFEIVSIDGYVQYFIQTPKKYRDLVESAIYSQYPEAEISEVPDYTKNVPKNYPDPEWDAFGTEYVLKKNEAYPIRTYTEFEDKSSEEFMFKDPISAILELMGSLKHGEQLWFQIRLTPTDEEWQKKGEDVVNKMLGIKKEAKKGVVDQVLETPLWMLKETSNQILGGAHAEAKKEDKGTPKILSMSPGERNVLEKIQNKLSKIGFMCKMRMVYVGKRNVFNKGRASQLKGALSQFTAINMNAFKVYGPVTPKGDYPWQRWSENDKKSKIVKNYAGRSGKGGTPFALNIEELATLYHFPMSHVKAPLVKKTEAKRAEPPSSLPTETRYPSVEIKAPPRPEKKPRPDIDNDGLPDNLPFE